MNNWYTIGIVFLAGLAAGLLGFLFVKPAQTGHQDPNTASTNEVSDTSNQLTESSSSSDKTAESSEQSETATNSSEEESSSEPSQTEEWTPPDEQSRTPELIFYYKPGWPLCQSTKDIVDDLKPLYVGDVDITYIPMRSDKGIQGRKKYNISYGMVLLDSNGEVFWKEQGLKFSRSKVKSQLDSITKENDS